METTRGEVIACGVLVEFYDPHGNLVGQALIPQWDGAALPSAGDAMACEAASPRDGNVRRLSGRVLRRHFDMQRDEDDQPCLWVRIDVAVDQPARPGRTARFAWN